MKLLPYCNLVFLLLIRSSCSSRLELRKLSENDDQRASKCLEALISVTDWMGHNFLAIFDETAEAEEKFLKRHTNFGWKIYSGGNANLTGFFNVILVAKNFHNLDKTLSAISIRRIDSRAKFVISVTENFSSLHEIRKASTGIPAAMWKMDKTRVVYLVPCKENILAMTYFPFDGNCQLSELEILDVWTGMGFENENAFFPEKMLDIRGCVQNQSIIFSDFLGFQLRKEFSKTGDVSLGGVGGRLITIVTEKMNLKLHLSSERPESWFQLVDQIARGESLFSIAGNIPTASRLEILEEDIGYMEESFGFAYITGDFQVSWKNLVWPLPLEAWGYIGVIFVLFCGLIFVANQRYRQKVAPDQLVVLDVFAVFLGSSRILPQSFFGRYLLGIWIIYSYLINAAYNSGLVSFLTTPRENRVITTFEDLLADGMHFGGETFHQEFYHDPSDPVMMKIYNNYKIWTVNESNYVFNNRRGARGVLGSFVYTYNSNLTGTANHKVRMLEDKALTFYSPIFMRRGSPFAFGVRRYISQVIQSGILEYWIKHYDRASQFTGTDAQSPIVISIKHIQGILYFCIAGLIFSSAVFVLELICHRYFSYHLKHN